MLARGNAFDLLRLIAALAVVVQHATAHLDVPFLWHRPEGPFWFYEGVTAFFVISGYFVFRSAERLGNSRRQIADFYRNRALRIIPALWTYVGVTVLIVLAVGAATAGDLVSAQGIAWIVSSLALFPVYSPGFLDDFGVGVVNGSLWTIPVEISFYAVVPLLVLLRRRMGVQAFSASLLGAAVVLHAARGGVSGLPASLLEITFVPHMTAFAAGIVWYLNRDSWRTNSWGALVAVLVYSGVRVLSLESVSPTLAVVVDTAAISYIVVHLGYALPRWCQTLPDRIGDLSFGVYIWHMIVVNLFLWCGTPSLMPAQTVAPAVVLLSLGLAWCSWHWVEKPALARKRSSSRAATT